MRRLTLCALGVWLAFDQFALADSELETAVVEQRTVPREYRLDGIVEAVNRGTISAQTQGEVLEIFYDVDDFVEEGSLVIRLKDTAQRARVAQATAQLKAAAARLQQARDDHERISGLFAKKAVSRSAMDGAEAELKTAQANQESASSALDEAREQLAYTRIEAPYRGIVTERHVEVGEIVQPGTPLITGISLSELRVVIDVPQSVIAQVRALSEARVYVGDRAVEPEKITFSPVADAGSNTFMVRLDLPPISQPLFPGMFVKAGLIIGKNDALLVPKQAVVHRSEVTGVYSLRENGDIRFRHIRTGRELGDALVVLTGLAKDDRVALDPVAAGIRLHEQLEQARAAAGEGHDG
ncbi:Efflux transporter, RND family, MFP subunit, AcrA/E family [Imhoffiella purpurea]|uniref:Efflux transporter, RND family, MFP subunit, AcrA/E family n=1 Tax=Imhoffiella purpurea TaxID=1249627 RepID=W9VIY2_9GAMM|nr:Efflux transporter, RND family, MFP subunit, AcrA/E family [Imhoffiella purpurea]